MAANGMYNVGTGSNGALRIVASYTDNDGYMDRVSRETGKTFDEGVNDEETTTVRAAYRYEFANAYIQPSVFWQETEMNGKPNYDGPKDEFEQVRRFDASEPFDDEFTMANITYGHDLNFLGGMDLLASASYIDREFDNVEDITDATDDIFGDDYGLRGQAVYADESAELEDTTVEIRLSSNDNENFHWLVGVYYKDAETDGDYRMQRGFDVPVDFGEFGLANTNDNREYEEVAGFTELTYEFLEDFSVTVGGRYLDYEISQYKEDFGWAFGAPPEDPSTLDASVSDDDVNGKLTATWHFQEQSQLYGTVSNGTRPGGFNRSVPRSEDPADSVAFACNEDLNRLGITGGTESFDGDEVVNYELGWKTELSQNVRFNGAIYLMEWDDIQQKITLSGECGVDLTTNIGDAESQGAEVELLANITDNFTVSLSGSYTDAELQDDVPTAGVEEGDNLPDVPEWTANLTLDYVYPVDTGEFFAVANWNYVDETLEFVGTSNSDVTDFGVISGNVKDDYDIIDLRIGFTSESNWEWVLYADNITDEEAIFSYSDALAFNLSIYDRTVRNRPRTIGTSFTYNF
jgi:outer membrane receptor protein involved in Fe transport